MVILCFFIFFKAEQLSIVTKHLTSSRFPLHTTDSSSPTLHLFCPLLSVSEHLLGLDSYWGVEAAQGRILLLGFQVH